MDRMAKAKTNTDNNNILFIDQREDLLHIARQYPYSHPLVLTAVGPSLTFVAASGGFPVPGLFSVRLVYGRRRHLMREYYGVGDDNSVIARLAKPRALRRAVRSGVEIPPWSQCEQRGNVSDECRTEGLD
jgi:hypothetical protein